ERAGEDAAVPAAALLLSDAALQFHGDGLAEVVPDAENAFPRVAIDAKRRVKRIGVAHLADVHARVRGERVDVPTRLEITGRVVEGRVGGRAVLWNDAPF